MLVLVLVARDLMPSNGNGYLSADFSAQLQLGGFDASCETKVAPGAEVVSCGIQSNYCLGIIHSSHLTWEVSPVPFLANRRDNPSENQCCEPATMS